MTKMSAQIIDLVPYIKQRRAGEWLHKIGVLKIATEIAAAFRLAFPERVMWYEMGVRDGSNVCIARVKVSDLPDQAAVAASMQSLLAWYEKAIPERARKYFSLVFE